MPVMMRLSTVRFLATGHRAFSLVKRPPDIARSLRPLPSLITARCDPFNVDAFRPLRFNPSNRSQEGCGHARLEVG
jgi:hypothetical protein